MRFHRESRPPDPRQEKLVKKRNALLMEVAGELRRELDLAYKIGDFLMAKGCWSQITKEVETMEREYDACWEKAHLAQEAPSDAREGELLLRPDELLEEFQRELTFAFSTGNFNPVKIYCQKVKERIEFMERKYKEEHARTKGENQKPEVKVPQVKHRNRYFPE